MSLYTHIKFVVIAVVAAALIVAVGDANAHLPGILSAAGTGETEKTLIISVSALIVQYIVDWLKKQEDDADAKLAGDNK